MSLKLKKFIFILIFLYGHVSIAQKHSEVAPKPPMGWNSWNCFRTEVDENKIKAIADAMVNSGMKEVGYEYIVIDDGWMTDKRDNDGHVIVNPERFPSGMKSLGNYIHSRGLKFGIYSTPGRFTCQNLIGSFGYEQLDANDYASWGVDYLKYDWCNYPGTPREAANTAPEDCRKAYELMRDCLRNTGRPIIYSVHSTCSGERKNSYPWVVDVANMHRSSDDIKDNWDRMLYCLDSTADLWQYAGPGFWNDTDVLEVGNTTKERLWGGISDVKMNLPEYRTHFSMWCMVAAPLLAGNNIITMGDDIAEILTNNEMIDIDQDALGKQGKRIRDDGDIEVWCKTLSGNRKAVALLNRSNTPADISFTWKEIDVNGKQKVRDVWAHEDLGKFKSSYTGKNIPPHEALILVIY